MCLESGDGSRTFRGWRQSSRQLVPWYWMWIVWCSEACCECGVVVFVGGNWRYSGPTARSLRRSDHPSDVADSFGDERRTNPCWASFNDQVGSQDTVDRHHHHPNWDGHAGIQHRNRSRHQHRRNSRCRWGTNCPWQSVLLADELNNAVLGLRCSTREA